MILSTTVVEFSTETNCDAFKFALDFANFILLLSTLKMKYTPSPPVFPPNKDDVIVVSSEVCPSPSSILLVVFWGL